MLPRAGRQPIRNHAFEREGMNMEGWQFGILAFLLIWILWRTRSIAQTSPLLRDALRRRIFEQLNRIEAQQRGVPVADVEKEDDEWWQSTAAYQRAWPRRWPWS
jgi:hypothetical protein